MSVATGERVEAAALHVAFLDGVSVARDGRDLVLAGGSGALRFASAGEGQREAFTALCEGPVAELELGEAVLARDGIGGLTQFLVNFGRCVDASLVVHAACEGGERLASCVPLVPAFRFREAELRGRRWTLSRFAYLRRRGTEMVLQSPLGFAEAVLHHPDATELVAWLAEPRTLDHCPALAGVLWNAGALAAEGDEERDEVLRQWEFQDLLFHAQTRAGRHGKPFGGTFRHVGSIDPLPAARPPAGSGPIALPRADVEALRADDVPFTAVLEGRVSGRAHGVPLTLGQLGEFLYRSARIRRVREVEVRGADGGGARFELSSRPYPGGGAIHELEIYVTAHRCDGLEPGLYHYDPLGHQLSLVRPRDARVEALLAMARATAGIATSPDVLITIASRFQRMSWKYETIAYAVSLKNAGALYQTFYLVATAMGLSACGLGNGDFQSFADASGLDPLVEGSIGEFMLGGPQ
jgi:SagB-type dehydrogenase family enzyme